MFFKHSVWFGVFLLVGCSSSTIVDHRFDKKPVPPPVIPAESVKQVEPPKPTTSIKEAPALPLPPKPAQPTRQLADGSQIPVVKTLLMSADESIAKGDWEGATRALERAQRLAPQSVAVYQRLAEVRLKQKRAVEAEQFARKALIYTFDTNQQATLWDVIASAQQQQGKSIPAQESRDKAAQLRAPSVAE